MKGIASKLFARDQNEKVEYKVFRIALIATSINEIFNVFISLNNLHYIDALINTVFLFICIILYYLSRIKDKHFYWIYHVDNFICNIVENGF